MANEKQTSQAHTPDYERSLYDDLQLRSGNANPQKELPAPVSDERWLEREAEGDLELLEHLVAKEALENNRVAIREAGRDDDQYMQEYHHARDELHAKITNRVEGPPTDQ